MRKGDIYSAGLGSGFGSEQSGFRPVLIVQNNKANKHAGTVTVVALTSSIKKKLPTHYKLQAGNFGLEQDSIILIETLRSIDKKRFNKFIGRLDCKTLKEIDKLLKIHLNLE